MVLHNTVDKQVLKKRLMEEPFERTTISFYKYVYIEDIPAMRDQLFKEWNELNIFGRIYIAYEGINAQMSVPKHNWKEFIERLNANSLFKNVPLKIAVDDNGKSFYKLVVRIRKKIVADGLNDFAFDVTNVGKHLTAKEFNDAMSESNTVVVDMRNHYESEVGHFENAVCPEVDTFRDALPKAVELLHDKKESKILLYCTGGIRCEKASSYFKHHGFNDVNQLYGGIIEYARQVKAENLPSKFTGKNFVFDERLGERISDDVISTCHQCGTASDSHVNCANNDCHLLFIQCNECAEKMNGCCTNHCKEIIALPIEDQRKLRKGQKKTDARNVYKSRLRPDLKKILEAEKSLNAVQ